MQETFFNADIIAQLKTAFYILWVTSPIWLTVVTALSIFNSFLKYKRASFWNKQKPILLEIKLPKEILKSPLAMEIVLGAMHQGGGEGTWIDRIWNGQTRPWFSLEIASLGGKIHFYIWTWAKHKATIESHIYSQYPGIEIHEVPDYSIPFVYNKEENDLWACQWELTQPDPYPIKTYIDYGLDKDPKEEFKIDPLVSSLEFIGSIPEGHNIFIQILVRVHKKNRYADVFSEQDDAWKKEAETQINKIVDKGKNKDPLKPGRPQTETEKEVIAALERSISKLPFDCSIRTIYMADKDKYNPSYIGGLTSIFRQYNSLNLNGFKPSGWMTWFSYPWQEWGGKKEWMKPRVLLEYKMRRFFFSPFKSKDFYSKPFVLNTEELATIYHFPGSVANVPTFERIPSRKAEAPSNLPT